MIATILFGIIAVIGLTFVIQSFRDDCYDASTIAGGIMAAVSITIILVSVLIGYVDHHTMKREDVVSALRASPNAATIRMAEDWNKEESMGNNIWCRFDLREENPIDIYAVLIEYDGGGR